VAVIGEFLNGGEGDGKLVIGEYLNKNKCEGNRKVNVGEYLNCSEGDERSS